MRRPKRIKPASAEPSHNASSGNGFSDDGFSDHSSSGDYSYSEDGSYSSEEFYQQQYQSPEDQLDNQLAAQDLGYSNTHYHQNYRYFNSSADEQQDSETDAGINQAKQTVTLKGIIQARIARRKRLKQANKYLPNGRSSKRIIWGVLSSIVLVAIVSVTLAFSPMFSVKKLTVLGTKTDSQLVEEKLKPLLGRSMAAVTENEVATLLADFPSIANFKLEKNPPETIVVKVSERKGIFAYKEAEKYSIYDRNGVLVRSVAQLPEGVLLLGYKNLSPESSTLEASVKFNDYAISKLQAKVEQLRVPVADDIQAKIRNRKTVVYFGNSDNLELKSRVALILLEKQSEATLINVSVPQRPTVSKSEIKITKEETNLPKVEVPG